MTQKCTDCGAPLSDNHPCETYFHQMLFWENEEPANGRANWRVHHLAVLCYHLQHPALYSPEGLEHGRDLLKKFVIDGRSPQEIRRHSKNQVASNNRQWKVKGSPASHGVYPVPIKWRMNAADIIAGGIENYCENVEKWAKTIQKQLEELAKKEG